MPQCQMPRNAKKRPCFLAPSVPLNAVACHRSPAIFFAQAEREPYRTAVTARCAVTKELCRFGLGFNTVVYWHARRAPEKSPRLWKLTLAPQIPQMAFARVTGRRETTLAGCVVLWLVLAMRLSAPLHWGRSSDFCAVCQYQADH